MAEKVPCFQVRENNWTLNANGNGKWNAILTALFSVHTFMERPAFFISCFQDLNLRALDQLQRGRVILSSSTQLPSPDPRVTLAMDPNLVVILAALLCSLFCILGLALLARCALLRRYPQTQFLGPTANRGIKKKVLDSIPKLHIDELTVGMKINEDCCAICLAEFQAGDEIRVLPQCRHGFHVACIDTWLRSHSSCPSCRRVLVVPVASACQKCVASSAGDSSTHLP